MIFVMAGKFSFLSLVPRFFAIGGGVICFFAAGVLSWAALAWLGLGHGVWWWLGVLWAGSALCLVTGLWFFLQLRAGSWLMEARKGEGLENERSQELQTSVNNSNVPVIASEAKQ